MRIVKKIILPVLLCAAIHTEAQQIDRSVVATAGSIRTAGGITVSHTIGENVVMLKQAGSLQMRQGFQQSAKKDDVGVRVLPITHLSASPNPFTTELKVNADEGQTINSIRIFSVDGRKVLERSYSNSNLATISTSDIAKGLYTIEVSLSNDGIFRRSIVKP